MVLLQLVLGPLGIGVLAGVRLETLGALPASAAGYGAFALAQIVAALWLLAEKA